ncbi:MAG: exopolysaccharide biosynthesis protein [Rikenellaceae bacterium]|nr:exopolysaccharide biosynthesis protein [Rikenellaceae bacterium]
MEIIKQVVRLLYRIRYWLIFLPALAAIIAINQTKNIKKDFTVSTTIFTGIASGFSIETGSDTRVDWSSVNNEVDNLISIIKSKATLRNVCLRLYAQHMIEGDSIRDNNFIRASNYRSLLRITPKEVKKLIDTSSIEQTVANLKEYEAATHQNFVYGLFNWFHHHYSYSALSRIDVRRIANSDMLQIQYSADDPGIAYNTLVILNEEFVKQYEVLRFSETNNVVDYFRSELEKLANKLRNSEDSLTQYYIDKKIINYPEQTKIIAALSRDYDLTFNDLLLKYTGSQKIVDDLEKKIDLQTRLLQNNSEFLGKLNDLTKLSAEAARLKAFNLDSSSINVSGVEEYNKKITAAEQDVKSFATNIAAQKYSREGIASTTYVEQWIEQLIIREKSMAELQVMEEIIRDLDQQYEYFSPVGSTIKRKEREINITEQSYLSLLTSLNTALMRQKNLQMTSATLQPIDPPLFPLYPNKTARRMIVLTSFFGTIVFILGLFILIEFFDMTVRDKERAERLIPVKVLGAYPRRNMFRFRRYNKEYKRLSINFLANSLVPYLNPKSSPDIINFISTTGGVGKSEVIDQLKEYWEERGLRVRLISWHESLPIDSRGFILSSNLIELYDAENEDIILVEHRPLMKSSIPVGLLREASINILTVRADKVWSDIDNLSFGRLKDQVGTAPLLTYLTNADRHVTESFVGLLPPYTFLRKKIYKIMQFGLTSS